MATATLETLDLPFLDIEAGEFSRDPVSRYVAARRQHPWLARCSIGYIVTEYAAMREVMRNDGAMAFGFNEVVEYMGATGTPWGNFIAGTIQVQSGAAHSRLRDAVRAPFAPRQVNRWREAMRATIDDLLDQWAPRGGFDFEEFVAHYPISVLCRMIGADTAHVPRIRSSLEALGLAMSMDRAILPQLQQATLLLEAFARELAAARRARGPSDGEPDVLDQLIAALDAGAMDEAEFVNLLIFLLVGGYDTSKNVMTLMMHALIERPEMYRRCGEDIAFCRRAMHETFRFHGPATATRKVIEPFDVRGVHFPAETLVLFPWGMAGRDPTAAADPHVFDPDRPGTIQHLGFGMGAHICLGQFIARAQIEEGFHRIARRLRNPRIAGEVGWRPYPGVWGIAGLPIAFEDGGEDAGKDAGEDGGAIPS